MQLKLALSPERYEQLIHVADQAHRPPVWQAEYLLGQAIEAACADGDTTLEVALVGEEKAAPVGTGHAAG